MRKLLYLTLVIFIYSCSTSRGVVNQTESEKNDFQVEFSGALKNMMHKGDLSAYASLNDFKNIEHLYALGAIEKLKGEILILDGIPYVSFVQENQLKIDNSFNYKASLLVNTVVKDWKEFDIHPKVRTYEDLEKCIASKAKQNNISMSEPFPFMIMGKMDSLSWHVINWPVGDNEHSHEKHISSGLHGTHKGIDVQILGFYSDRHHAIFTHHTTNMHLHFISRDKSKTGHVDGLRLGNSTKLLLPK